jgi:hypothetical protein
VYEKINRVPLKTDFEKGRGGGGLRKSNKTYT